MSNQPENLGTITVYGTQYGNLSYSISLGGSWRKPYDDGEHHETSAPPLNDNHNDPVSDPDIESIEIIVNINRPLKVEEKQAIDELSKAISRITIVINSIPDNATITLNNGHIVTGIELKQLWQKIDFDISKAGTTYLNGTQNGEIDYNNGNPIARLNINIVTSYNALNPPGGINYLPLHELAHITSAGRKSNQSVWANGKISPHDPAWSANERIANDIAKAIADFGGLAILPNARYGYSNPPPAIIVTP